MDNTLKNKEKTLERLKIEDEIQSERTSIAEKKALEREMKKKYGRDWKHILGFAGGLLSPEAKQNLYSVNPELRELTKPVGLRRL